MSRSSRAHVAVAVAVAVSTGCGIPADTAPRPVTPPAGPFRELAPPEPATPRPGTVDERLYLVRDDRLVLVTRQLPATPPIDVHVRNLLAGATDSERDAGLSNALDGFSLDVALDGSTAVLDIGDLADTGRNDQVLAFGQIVCTLHTRPEVSAVRFVRDGRPLGVPRDDGSLSTGPLTAADYARLLAPR
jgi:hypothetical protein